MSETRMTREKVSEAYARAVTSDDGAGCCGSSPKGRLARVAGYDETELAGIPPDAVCNSFGCGNPLAFSEVQPGQVVLDLGCGAGIDVVLAAKKVGPTGRVIGVDMTDEMIDRARRNLADAGMFNAEIRKGIIEEMPVESGSVDWVISNCVINLSPEKPRVFAEIARVLKPGGRMIVSDVIAEGLPPEVLEDLTLFSSCVAGAISEREYREGLLGAGLTDVRITKAVEMSAGQMSDLIESDLLAAQSPCGCDCGTGGENARQTELAKACVGKVWSARISACKPKWGI